MFDLTHRSDREVRACQAAAREALRRGDLGEARRVLAQLAPSDFYADEKAGVHLAVLRDPRAESGAILAAARAVVRLVPAGATLA